MASDRATVAQLDKKVDLLIQHVQIIDDKMEKHLVTGQQFQDALLRDLNGEGDTNPGLKRKVDRLEQDKQKRDKSLSYVWTAIWSIVVGLVLTTVGRLH